MALTARLHQDVRGLEWHRWIGVAGATEQITTGQRITVDGAAGTVVLDFEPAEDAVAVQSRATMGDR